jgi:ferredoxin--NADP+ reductase
VSAPNDKVASVRITSISSWTDHLFSFKTERPAGFKFTAGQFARLGLPVAPGSSELVWRAYSIASGPYDDELEYYSIVVPGGAFTSQLKTLKVGDELLMERQNHGFLTIDRFALTGDLWMLASGTGLAPFLSILQDPQAWEAFDRLILVHSVRAQAELAYKDWIDALPQHPIFGDWAAEKFIYQPVVTREATTYPAARIPNLIDSGELSRLIGRPLSPEAAKCMLCGNPEMVTETRNSLKKHGFVSARSSRPGQIATENYW